ncbi:hypothetical protein BH23VER1_BH23VER1_06340 [soil metagenome]
MRSTPRPARASAGYTLIEVMIALGILLAGVAVAAQLTLTMQQQEESSAAIARGISLLEGAHTLYQLGLTTGEAALLLPSDPAVTLSSTTAGLTLPVETPNLETVGWQAEVDLLAGDGSERRTLSLRSARPSIR